MTLSLPERGPLPNKKEEENRERPYKKEGGPYLNFAFHCAATFTLFVCYRTLGEAWTVPSGIWRQLENIFKSKADINATTLFVSILNKMLN